MPKSAQQRNRVSLLSSMGLLIMFQVRLACDALRDLVMSPVSIAAFLLDIIFRPEPQDSFHQRLMLFGRRTDRWVNLFGEFSRKPTTRRSGPSDSPRQNDDSVKLS